MPSSSTAETSASLTPGAQAISGLPLVESLAGEEVADVAARLLHEQDRRQAVPGVDVVLDIAVAPAGGDIGDAERARAGAERRRAPERHAAQEIEILGDAGAHVPADLDGGVRERRRLGRPHRRAVEEARRRRAARRTVRRGRDRRSRRPRSTPSSTQAIDTQKCGTPRAKFAVPSIGSTTQTGAALAAGAARRLLADEAVARKGLVQAGGDQVLGLAVDLGQIVLRTLEADLKEESRNRLRASAPASRATAWRRKQRNCIGSASAFLRKASQKWL